MTVKLIQLQLNMFVLLQYYAKFMRNFYVECLGLCDRDSVFRNR